MAHPPTLILCKNDVGENKVILTFKAVVYCKELSIFQVLSRQDSGFLYGKRNMAGWMYITKFQS